MMKNKVFNFAPLPHLQSVRPCHGNGSSPPGACVHNRDKIDGQASKGQSVIKLSLFNFGNL